MGEVEGDQYGLKWMNGEELRERGDEGKDLKKVLKAL